MAIKRVYLATLFSVVLIASALLMINGLRGNVYTNSLLSKNVESFSNGESVNSLKSYKMQRKTIEIGSSWVFNGVSYYEQKEWANISCCMKSVSDSDLCDASQHDTRCGQS